jgi:hypothetical protein
MTKGRREKANCKWDQARLGDESWSREIVYGAMLQWRGKQVVLEGAAANQTVAAKRTTLQNVSWATDP